ncbi:hypothetical protein GTN42_05805, partial [bacterium]|nr:hypothetical protein [bacterium]NIO18944.1 hypothetical protein [bacterium]
VPGVAGIVFLTTENGVNTEKRKNIEKLLQEELRKKNCGYKKEAKVELVLVPESKMLFAQHAGLSKLLPSVGLEDTDRQQTQGQQASLWNWLGFTIFGTVISGILTYIYFTSHLSSKAFLIGGVILPLIVLFAIPLFMTLSIVKTGETQVAQTQDGNPPTPYPGYRKLNSIARAFVDAEEAFHKVTTGIFKERNPLNWDVTRRNFPLTLPLKAIDEFLAKFFAPFILMFGLGRRAMRYLIAIKEEFVALSYHFRIDSIIRSYKKAVLLMPKRSKYSPNPDEEEPEVIGQGHPDYEKNKERIEKIKKAVKILRKKGFTERADSLEKVTTILGLTDM